MGKRMLCFYSLLLAAFLLLVSGCTPSGTEGDSGGNANQKNPSGDLTPLKKKTTVVIAEDGAASGAGFYIAKEKGYFADYNIEVKFAQFANSDDMLPALAAGEVDIAGGVSTASFFNAIAQGIDVKIIADKGHNVKGKSYFSFVIGKDKQGEIKEYADFKGKRIAISTKDGVDDYIFEQMIAHGGLTREEVKFVLMPDFGSMMAAVNNGTVDAALQIEPFITQGEKKGLHVRFGDTTDYAPEAQIAMVLASPQFVNKEKEVSLRFMTAYLKGVRDYNDAFMNGKNKAEIIQIMTKHTALKDEKMWENVFVTGLNPDGQMYVKDIKKQYDMYKANGAIRGTIDLDQAIDPSLAAEAVKIIGGYETNK